MPSSRTSASRWSPRLSPSWLRALLGGAAGLLGLSLAPACLERPVTPVEPKTTNQFVDQIKQDGVDKIDLLFMIDNSLSMADKQAMLKQAVPVMLQRLVSPPCVDETGQPVGGTAPCALGSPEFTPIQDIHIAVVTSSLGDMGGGAGQCTGTGDGGRLIGTAVGATPLPSWNGQGFLAWDPDVDRPRNDPPGTRSATELVTDFQNMVDAAGETGCGYEASLESWYRFLIDPEPPTSVTFKAESGTEITTTEGVDETILNQRRQFLRADSLVAIVLLTDENDCSLIDHGRGGRVGSTAPMPRANSACQKSLDDPCCGPCDEPRAGCLAPEEDPICLQPPLTQAEDQRNLRCYRQKERFGRDFLQPLGRYLDGLTQPQIYNRRGELVQNPLFAAAPGQSPRDRSLVYLAAITGVPWQDVADEASWSDPTRLRYLTYRELEQAGRWDWIVGKPGEPPLDPLMVETPQDRTTIPGLPQAHPAGAAFGALAPSSSTGLVNPINGHESNLPENNDLQYACIFKLSQPRTCTGSGCDCGPEDLQYNRALCEGTTQTHAKAYPGTRQLQLLRSFGERTENAIVASICPKVTESENPATDPSYGYNPAVNAIVDRLKERIGAKCLPRALAVDDQGQVDCVVVEARPGLPGGSCGSCVSAELPGRAPVREGQLDPSVRAQLAAAGHCDGSTGVSCQSYCLCEVQQLAGAELERCRTTSEPLSDPQGYCYVDDQLGPADDPMDPKVRARVASVATCPATQRRMLRFSSEVPARGAVAFMACSGDSLSD